MMLKRKFHIVSTWLLLFSLSAHFLFFHGMFDFNVICFEKDGSTNIEYSIDGKTCIDHSSQLNDNLVSLTAPKNKDCKDVSLTELNHNDDQFIIKKIDNSISNVDLIFSSLIYLSVKQNFLQAYNNFTTIQSNSIQQLKTVSLLI
jgi:hypothetical protein